MTRYESFFHYFNAPYSSSQTKEKTRRVKTVITYAFFLSFVLFLYSIGTYFKLHHTELALIEILISLICFLFPFYYKKTGNFSVTANGIIFCGLIILSTASFYSGGIRSPVIFWIALCPMCAGMIRGKNSVITWGVVSLLVPVLFNAFDTYIQNFSGQITDPKVIFALRVRAIYGTIIFSVILNYMNKKFIDDMVEQLTDANQQIQNFIRVLGHDIANPLTIILGSSGIGKKLATTENEKKLWTRTLRASQTIEEILGEVLTLQAMESGKFHLKLKPVSINTIIEKSKFVFEDKMQQKNLKLICNIDKDINVMADEVSLSNQVINNLISNAVKFSRIGSSIEVAVNERETEIDISIKDSGIGIPKEILDNLFDYRFKTSRKGTAGESGTGFGMPLVKFFIDQYGGRLRVETKSEDEGGTDHGTSFILTLKKVETDSVLSATH